MNFRKIFGPFRIYSESNGDERKHELPYSNGGSSVKRLQYMVVISAISGGDTRIAVDLCHGPDGRITKSHSTVISGVSSLTAPVLLEGSTSDTASLIGEYIHPIVRLWDSEESAEQWAEVTVYEMRKSF